MNEHDHVVFGSLLHDVGKLFERAGYFEKYCRHENNQKLYRSNDDNRQLDQRLMQCSLYFCEQLSAKIALLNPSVQKMPEQHWLELAVNHYQISTSHEAYLEKLVQAADCFATAEHEQQGNQKTTRLESLLSRISLNNRSNKTSYFLPLAPLALEEKVIYPQSANGEVQTSDYETIAEAFLNELKHLPDYTESNQNALRAIARTLLALLEKYLGQIPAASPALRPDISLFDHLRISAAIAEGLYDCHSAKGDLITADYNDQKTAKWCLVCGDFSGIQNFIYKITSKGAAKGLRGRSFFIQLLCDAASEQIIRTLGLYPSARIYSSGGKFYLLISASRLKALKKEVENINKALLLRFRGEMSLTIGVADIKADDFKEGAMGARWQQANEDLMKNRQQVFAAQLNDKNFFNPEDLHSKGACQVCDRDDKFAHIELEHDNDGSVFKICRQCKELRKIGQHLVNTQYLFWVWGDDRAIVKRSKLRYRHRINLCGTDCTLYFLENSPELTDDMRLYDCHLETLNNFDLPHGNAQGYSSGFRLVGKWQANKASSDIDFEEFAKRGEGIERMGVLRMDVDNLGEIFVRGLTFKETASGLQKTMGSLSRIATLSRQLHLFFAGYLGELLNGFQNSQIIYAGGDDVFIIGSWHELPEIAEKIRNEFNRYCADNENFTLSGGIALAAGKYPISKLAEAAGDAESQAKQLKAKDALSFLDTVIGWENFETAKQLKKQICALSQKTKSHALIDRLRQVVIATEAIKAKQNHPDREIIYWNQWRWRLIYNLKRMAQREQEIEPALKDLQKQLLALPQTDDRQMFLDWLAIPVRWAEFLQREEK